MTVINSPTLAIAVGDYLNTGFTLGTRGAELVSSVTQSVVDNQNSYAVVVPSGTYTCTPSNTTLSDKLLNGVSYWILGA